MNSALNARLGSLAEDLLVPELRESAYAFLVALKRARLDRDVLPLSVEQFFESAEFASLPEDIQSSIADGWKELVAALKKAGKKAARNASIGITIANILQGGVAGHIRDLSTLAASEVDAIHQVLPAKTLTDLIRLGLAAKKG